MIELITEQTNLKKVIHRLLCPDCREEMKAGDMVLTTFPAKYEYTCPKCNKVLRSYKLYPYNEIVGSNECTYQQEIEV